MILSILKSEFAISRLERDALIPNWAQQGSFFSVTKTAEELSIVCEQELVPHGMQTEKNWKLIMVHGPLDFGLTGILASIANPLANRKVSIFAVSTFDTDYIMVKESNLDRARNALVGAGFTFEEI